MEKYIVINLNQAESAESRIERIRERVRHQRIVSY